MIRAALRLLPLFGFACFLSTQTWSQTSLGINLTNKDEYASTRVIRLTLAGGVRGSKALILVEIPASEQQLTFSAVAMQQRVSLQSAASDRIVQSLSPWEIDGKLNAGQGTGFWVQAVGTGEPGQPADIVALRSKWGTIRIEIWTAPVEGQWRPAGQNGQELNTGVVGVHAALLREGENARVLFFSPPGRHPDGHVDWGELNNMDASLWDIASNQVSATRFSQNLFCSGHALLPDGRLLVAGGHIGGGFANNARGVFTFDAFPESSDGITPRNFAQQPVQMQNARWYPTVTTLPDGRMLISSGRGAPLTGTRAWDDLLGWYRTIARDYEVFQLDEPPNSFGHLVRRFIPNSLEDENVDFATYPAVMVLPRGVDYPDGAIFMQEQRLGRLYAYEPQAERVLRQARAGRRSTTWTMNHQGSRSYPYYGAAVLLPFSVTNPERLRILATGGQGGRYRHNPLHLDQNEIATNTTEIFEFDPRRPLNTQIGWRFAMPMSNARLLHDATLLADGSVLISGGAGKGWTNVNRSPVKQAELFDPVSMGFRPAATERFERAYHSVALLLPDGTVLKAGSTGGYSNDQEYRPQLTAERFFPPYMWRGPRPSIKISGVAPPTNQLIYRHSFELQIAGHDVHGARIALVRTTSVTHGNNMDQRYIWLDAEELQREHNSKKVVIMRVRAPEHGSVAPPGDYMLIAVDRFGVPSEATFVRLG